MEAAPVGARRPVAYLTRVEKFNAAHRLHSSKLTDEENVATYGKCNNTNGHGHNYTLEVTVRGPVDPRHGMVMNLTDLKGIIAAAVLEPMDHRNLDKDVPQFRDGGLVSTAENIAVVAYEAVSRHLPAGVALHHVKLHETDKNIVTFRGEYE